MSGLDADEEPGRVWEKAHIRLVGPVVEVFKAGTVKV